MPPARRAELPNWTSELPLQHEKAVPGRAPPSNDPARPIARSRKRCVARVEATKNSPARGLTARGDPVIDKVVTFVEDQVRSANPRMRNPITCSQTWSGSSGMPEP